MLKIRLQRRGKRNYATFRVVVAEDKAPIKGRFIDDLGHYNPHTDEFKVDAKAVENWIQKGVRPTPTINNLLITHKVIKGEKVTSWKPKKKEEESTKTDQAAPAASEAQPKEKPQDTPEAEKAPEAK